MAEWAIDRLRPDPRNREVFDPLGGEDLIALVESIREHGLINPITIRPDGLIIAGEQRWRAATQAGLATVPVTVRDVADDAEVELIRIAENLRRRTIKVSETAKAIRREREVREARIRRTAQEASSIDPMLKQPSERAIQGQTIAETKAEHRGQPGMSGAAIERLDRLADLIPPLMALLDDGTLSKDGGYQLAQLPEVDQERIAAAFTPEDIADKTALELRALRQQVQAANAQLKQAEAALAKADAEHQVELEAEVAAMREKKDREIRALRDERDRAREWARSDAVHSALSKLGTVTGMSVEKYAEYVGRFGSLEVYIQADIELAEQAVPWLNDLARHLRARLNQPEKGVRVIR